MRWLWSTIFVIFISVFSVFGNKGYGTSRSLYKQYMREKHDQFVREKEINPDEIDRVIEAERKNSVLYGNPHPIHKDDWIDIVTVEKHARKGRKFCKKLCPKRYRCIRSKSGMERCVHKKHRKKSQDDRIIATRRTEYPPKYPAKNEGDHKLEKYIPYIIDDEDDPTLLDATNTNINDVISPGLRRIEPKRSRMLTEGSHVVNHIDDNAHGKQYGELVGRTFEKPISMKINVVDITENKDTDKESPTVWNERSHRSDIEITDNDGCNRDDLEEIRRRLSGWFALIHARDKEHRRKLKKLRGENVVPVSRTRRDSINVLSSQKEGSTCECINSVMWLRKYLDKNNDQLLEHKELKVIEQNNNEQCLRPFIQSCDQDLNGYLTKDEWCCCFADVLPPCFKQIRDIMANLSTRRHQGRYIPRCTTEGYFEKEQCNRGDGACWCVDLNGNEVAGTRKKGSAHCGKYDVMGHPLVTT